MQRNKDNLNSGKIFYSFIFNNLYSTFHDTERFSPS